MIQEGKIRDYGNGNYEIFSYEVMQSGAKKGEIAQEDEYEQKRTVIRAWNCHEHMCKEIHYLMEKKGFKINSDDFERYYVAPLWGTLETADKDSKVVFYGIKHHKNAEMEDISFSLVIRKEFENTYSVIGKILQ